MSVISETEKREELLESFVENLGEFKKGAAITMPFSTEQNGQFNYTPETYTVLMAENKKTNLRVSFTLSMIDKKIYKGLNRKTMEFVEEFNCEKEINELNKGIREQFEELKKLLEASFKQ